MLVTNHVLSGALVGWAAPGPVTALAAGFASHFALDAVPHFGVDDEDLMKIAVPDGLVGLGAIGVVAAAGTPADRRTRVLAGIVGACLPDLNKPTEVFLGRSPFPAWFDRFHSGIQSESTRRFPVEVAAAMLFVAALRAVRRRAGR